MAGRVVKVSDQVPQEQGQKPKKPIFKRPVFWVAIVIVVLLVGSCAARGGNKSDDASSHVNEVQAPISSSSASGKNYEDVETQFKTAGFADVTSKGEGDMVTGWLTNEGDVDTVSINGETSFGKDDWFAKDAKVVIRYHSYPEKDADDNAEERKDSKSSEKTDKASSGTKGDTKKKSESSSSSSKVSSKFKKTMDLKLPLISATYTL